MPFCPECRAEYRPGFTRCASCDVDLVESLPEFAPLTEEEMRKALEGKELVAITSGYIDAVLEMRDQLAGMRILSLVEEAEKAPPQPGLPRRVKLMVAKDSLEAAAACMGETFRSMVAQEGLKPNAEITYERCPACNSPVPPDAEECPECGLVVGKGG
jgi:hypothetical protein